VFVRIASRHKPVRPWVTMLAVAIGIVLFIAENQLTGTRKGSLLLAFGTVPTRLFGALHGPGWAGLIEIGKLFSGLFLHADWPHLLGNLVFLLIFGSAAEPSLGSLRFFFLMLVCGALANLAGAYVYPQLSAPIIGSSGAVSAILGAYITLFPRARLGLVIPLGLFIEFVRIPALTLIGLWILIQGLFVIVGPGTGALAWPIHLVGFVSGALIAYASRPAIARRLRNA